MTETFFFTKNRVAAAFIAITAAMIFTTPAPAEEVHRYTANSNCLIGVKNHYHSNKKLRLFWLAKCRAEKAAIMQKATPAK